MPQHRKGKPLNAYTSSLSAVTKNKEIGTFALVVVSPAAFMTIKNPACVTGNLMKCLGLQIGKDYSTELAMSSLRYRHIVLLCDADVDGMYVGSCNLAVSLVLTSRSFGRHITWLIWAWLQRFFPTLLQNGFVKRFISPMIIASKGAQKKEFFNLAEFNTFAAARDISRWKVKYFKASRTISPPLTDVFVVSVFNFTSTGAGHQHPAAGTQLLQKFASVPQDGERR